MSVTLSNIETLVREAIDDESTTVTDIFEYTNSSVFSLSEENSIAISNVLVNDVESGVGYDFVSATNKVTITSPSLIIGDIVQINYTAYEHYSSTEIQRRIKHILRYLSINQYTTFTIINSTLYPEPDDAEINLITILTALKINPENKSISFPDMSIRVKQDRLEDIFSSIIAKFKFDGIGQTDSISRGIFD